CTGTVNVTSAVAGSYLNSTGPVSSTEGGAGAASTATLKVVAPPTTVKAFTPASIVVNGTSALTITITNPSANTVTLTGVGFTDTFPANLVVATPSGLTNTCGGTPTATAGSGSVSLTGGSIAVNSSCTVTVNVTSAVSGSYLNSTGPVSSTEGGTGAAGTATLNVATPPTTVKAFTPASIAVNGTSALTITITNPSANTIGLTGVGFTDTFPANLLVATPNGLTNTCGGTPAATAGSGSVSLTGGSIAVNSSCTVTVNVTSAVAGSYPNSTGPVSSTEGGAGAAGTATLTVVTPPTTVKAFTPSNIAPGGTSSMTITITNP